MNNAQRAASRSVNGGIAAVGIYVQLGFLMVYRSLALRSLMMPA